MKAVNDHVQHEFQEWGRTALPRTVVIQDLDSWALSISDGDYHPVALIELKRSFIAPHAWRPYAADRPNYASLLNLARAASVPLFVVYYTKGTPIVDETRFHVFRLDAATPEYHGRRKVITARTFARMFPNLFRSEE